MHWGVVFVARKDLEGKKVTENRQINMTVNARASGHADSQWWPRSLWLEVIWRMPRRVEIGCYFCQRGPICYKICYESGTPTSGVGNECWIWNQLKRVHQQITNWSPWTLKDLEVKITPEPLFISSLSVVMFAEERGSDTDKAERGTQRIWWQ